MLAHIVWNCALKAGSFRMSSLYAHHAQHVEGSNV